MKLLVVFCSTEPCGNALEAYLPLVQKTGAGLAVMDFSRVMGKDAEEANKIVLREIKKSEVPVCFFGQEHLEEIADKLLNQIPQEIISMMLAKRLDYGWMRNKGYLLGLAAGVKVIQFFDIDTAPLEKHGDILDVHYILLQEAKMAAVSGTYYGPRQVTTSMFKTIEGQIKFLRLLREATSFDVLNPPAVGGVLAVNLDFAKIAPFPPLIATTMSDDLLVSYLAKLLDWQTQQSGELVDHRHGGKLDVETRQGRDWTTGYFARLMRMSALMTIFQEDKIKIDLREIINYRWPKKNANLFDKTFEVLTKNQLEVFLEKLSEIAEDEGNELVVAIVNSLREGKIPSTISIETVQEVIDYMDFLLVWPEITATAEALGLNWVRL